MPFYVIMYVAHDGQRFYLSLHDQQLHSEILLGCVEESKEAAITVARRLVVGFLGREALRGPTVHEIGVEDRRVQVRHQVWPTRSVIDVVAELERA